VSASSSAELARPRGENSRFTSLLARRPRTWVAWWAEDVGTYLAWRPEWPVVVVTAAAWVALLLGVPGAHRHSAGSASGAHQHGHAMAGMGAPGADVEATTQAGTAGLLLGWALMCAAMMLPLALPAARHVAANTFRPRRPRALTVFAIAYLVPLLSLGLLLPPADVAIPGRDVRTGVLVGLGLLLAALWQVSVWKRWAVLSCSETVPLPPGGLAADRACAEFGVRQGLRCLAACWPLMALMGVVMVVPTTLSHTALLAGMAVGTAMSVAESRSRRRREIIPVLAAPLVVAAALAWVTLA
jgi:predicted metal-binding membrane protein